MRVTSDVLLKIAQDYIQAQAKKTSSLLAAFVHGAALSESPLLSGTGDIDLFLIFNESMPETRQMQRVTDEIHLDIASFPRNAFQQTRKIRLHPWFGPAINACKILYDPQHFLDFIQASVRGQFARPDNILARSQSQVVHSRQIWLEYQLGLPEPTPQAVQKYLMAVSQAANAIACLSGAPLTERRFLIEFPQRTQSVGQSELLFGSLLGLLGTARVNLSNVTAWLQAWRDTYEAVPEEQRPASLSLYRRQYYQQFFEAFLETGRYALIIWPLWRSWTKAAACLPESSPERVAWRTAGEQLGLIGDAFAEKIYALDVFLDLIEEILEVWAQNHGAAA
jgi:hypothetical protein